MSECIHEYRDMLFFEICNKCREINVSNDNKNRALKVLKERYSNAPSENNKPMQDLIYDPDTKKVV